ncbi:site-specific integrase [Pseudomonas syringae pv. syringae]|uniref:site-specific integrase n=1 Tax=Pseudomonas syringae TaxID=317 RepID=UPI002009EF4F|nr:site-specific integrase [Pseudomonas syringae]MCK9701865.1 site-specific integrase [Pseudomonas syringae pv. syringae]MCK9757361.1 site-specific integrase [Pseudomonas syringae pv. syringae]MCK9773624.1 site-specific integrase [Pseudomonas syringae pv. syringae]
MIKPTEALNSINTIDFESSDISFATPSEIALDLHATARSAAEGRIFWEDNKLIMLGKLGVSCKYLFVHFSPEIKDSFQRASIGYFNNGQVSSSGLRQIVSAMRTAAKKKPLHIIDSQWVSQALPSFTFRQLKEPIRNFLEYWKDGYPSIVTDDALNLLAQARAASSISSNVESDDPDKSWLTDHEYEDLLQATWAHYDFSGCTQPALIRLLSLQYARRPSQLASLKFGDLKSGSDKELVEHHENEIHFPAAKECFVSVEFRGGRFEAHPIAKHLWDLLKIQRQQIKTLFEHSFGLSLGEDDISQLPIFTTEERILKANVTLREKLGLDPRQNLADELFHSPPVRIGRVIGFHYNMLIHDGRKKPRSPYTAPPAVPLSPRTGRPIAVKATRLRHTRVRQLARMGVPRPILSFWLGHNDDDALKSYYNDPAERAREIDQFLAPGLAPIAQAFHGRIIATDAEATHPDDSMKRLELAKNGQLLYMGKCGKFTFCSTTSVPVPCYRCRVFEPLVDAPHEEVLEALIYRQAQELAVIKPGSMRNLLNPIDLSADIRAVERCIALCKAKREQM